MLEAVLFDLDGTLLDIDIDVFLEKYFQALGPVLANMLGRPDDVRSALAAVIAGTEEMQREHPGATNRQVFEARFLAETGLDLRADSAAHVIDTFYTEAFPRLKGDLGPREGARAAVDAAKSLGLKVAIATNPIFPRSAILERMAWAGISEYEVDLITSYEESPACKPSAAYYRSVASGLGVEPRACLMVGDDGALDMPAAEVGMRTYYVGGGVTASTDGQGDLLDLADWLTELG